MAIGKGQSKTKYYPLQGVPLNKQPTRKTTNIPFVTGLPLRRELSSFYEDSKKGGAEVQRQWTLYILALEKFKARSVDDKLSYFQIAGIHGFPETTWDDVPIPEQTEEGPFRIQQKPDDKTTNLPKPPGYCHHNDTSFPIWHRPYLLLFEQRIYEEMIEVIEKTLKLTGNDAKVWTDAAKQWRLPYWDWALKDSQGNFALPAALTVEKVKIYMPKQGAVDYPNPLWGFVNPEKENGKSLPFGKMPKGKEAWNIGQLANQVVDWSQTSGVSRHGIKKNDDGTYEGLEGRNEWKRANDHLNNFSGSKWTVLVDPSAMTQEQKDKIPKLPTPGNLADAVNRLLTEGYTTSWEAFSSTRFIEKAVDQLTMGYMSVEYIHNIIHYVAGGGADGQGEDQYAGHMGDVPVAALDPLFWLHHCNIDRLVASWQVLNWKTYWATGSEPKTYDLVPFHGASDKYHTADLARDWTQLNYQYDSLEAIGYPCLPNGALDEAAYKNKLLEYVRQTYPGTQNCVNHIKNDSPDLCKKVLGTENCDKQMWDDYLINVVYDRYALGGCSYTIEFWLGESNDSLKKINEKVIGCIHSFGGLVPSTTGGGCANCGSQRDNKVLSKGQVPLTLALLHHAMDPKCEELATACGSSQNSRTDTKGVRKFLKDHLHWRFVKLCGEVVPASKFPDTKISVWMGKGGCDANGNLTYGGYTPMHTPTHGKPCGLTNNDKFLGNDCGSKWKFAKFKGCDTAGAKKPASPVRNGAVVVFKNVGAGTCIDLTASNPANNTPVIGYQYNATKNQQWKLEQVSTTGSSPAYMIRNQQTKTCLDLYNGGQANNTPIVGWQGGNTSNSHQQWRFIAKPNDASIVMIQNVGTGTFIDLFNGGTANSTKIVGWAGDPAKFANTHQQWKVETV